MQVASVCPGPLYTFILWHVCEIVSSATTHVTLHRPSPPDEPPLQSEWSHPGQNTFAPFPQYLPPGSVVLHKNATLAATSARISMPVHIPFCPFSVPSWDGQVPEPAHSTLSLCGAFGALIVSPLHARNPEHLSVQSSPSVHVRSIGLWPSCMHALLPSHEITAAEAPRMRISSEANSASTMGAIFAIAVDHCTTCFSTPGAVFLNTELPRRDQRYCHTGRRRFCT